MKTLRISQLMTAVKTPTIWQSQGKNSNFFWQHLYPMFTRLQNNEDADYD